MKNTENCLDISHAIELLPSNYKPTIKKINRNNIYKANNGNLIAFSCSKDYGNSIWWYSTYIYNLAATNVKDVCFIIGFQGIILLPIELLLSYAEYADSKEYPKGTRFYIRIRKQDDDYIMYHSKHNDIILTQYYIPNDKDDSFIDDMNSKPLKSIYEKAIQFNDYEDQYYHVTKVIKQRHESKIQKERIAILENHTCQICGFHQAYNNTMGKKRWIIEVDHIIEKAQGGGESINNLLVLCPNCHAKKTYGIIKIDENLNVFENGEKIEISNNHIKMNNNIIF